MQRPGCDRHLSCGRPVTTSRTISALVSRTDATPATETMLMASLEPARRTIGTQARRQGGCPSLAWRIVMAALVVALLSPGWRPVLAQDDGCPEPNDDIATACPFAEGVVVRSTLSAPSDVDMFRITVGAGIDEIRVELFDLPADYDLYLTDARGRVLGQSVHEGTAAESLQLGVQPGTYFATVRADVSRAVVPDQMYTLRLSFRMLTGVPTPVPAAPRRPPPRVVGAPRQDSRVDGSRNNSGNKPGITFSYSGDGVLFGDSPDLPQGALMYSSCLGRGCAVALNFGRDALGVTGVEELLSFALVDLESGPVLSLAGGVYTVRWMATVRSPDTCSFFAYIESAEEDRYSLAFTGGAARGNLPGMSIAAGEYYLIANSGCAWAVLIFR